MFRKLISFAGVREEALNSGAGRLRHPGGVMPGHLQDATLAADRA